MKQANRILVVINRSSDARYVLDKAATLAEAEHASVMVIRVVYEGLVELERLPADEGQSLKVYIMQSEEEFLRGIVEGFEDRFNDLETATIWHRNVSDGALHAAKQFEADLVIKAVDSDGVVGRHPDDWSLLRNATSPVMLLKESQWPKTPVVLAAADLLDDVHDSMSSTVIETGEHIAAKMGGKLAVVSAYPDIPEWPGSKVDRASLEGELEHLVKAKLDALGGGSSQLIVRGGKPSQAVADVAHDMHAAFLVIGNVARSGVAGEVLGNTSEAVLNRVDSDIVVLRAS